MLWLLIGEIERCLKKVQEGVDAFEEIWKKVCFLVLLDFTSLHEAWHCCFLCLPCT